jgi:hypothetical protein
MLNELYSDGVFPSATFLELEDLYRQRNELVHGFVAEELRPSAVQFIVETARGLLNESEPAKQTV